MTKLVDLGALGALADKVEAAERALDDARRERDEGIRDVRRSTSHTVDEIAEAARVSTSTVKVVIRGVR
ncbi:hypothetical protein [Parafrankia sp. FMc2]|uniref:hypothetical protein n=1 Tax=Parafrankia sp. FMc2 TaxID=3233196 RepID=UPI0034D6AD35